MILYNSWISETIVMVEIILYFYFLIQEENTPSTRTPGCGSTVWYGINWLSTDHDLVPLKASNCVARKKLPTVIFIKTCLQACKSTHSCIQTTAVWPVINKWSRKLSLKCWGNTFNQRTWGNRKTSAGWVCHVSMIRNEDIILVLGRLSPI